MGINEEVRCRERSVPGFTGLKLVEKYRPGTRGGEGRGLGYPGIPPEPDEVLEEWFEYEGQEVDGLLSDIGEQFMDMDIHQVLRERAK